MHGDEVYGIELYNAILTKHPELADYISLIVGNERAYSERKRYIDTDMNRSFGLAKESHELQEIARLKTTLRTTKPDYILDIHTTRRDSGNFFISGELNASRIAICSLFNFDVCVMKDPVINTSFIGNNSKAISLEYSLKSIDASTTLNFIENTTKLITQAPLANANTNQTIYEVERLISPDEYSSYSPLVNYEIKNEGTALMVPKDESEMDAEYFGFWCKEAA